MKTGASGTAVLSVGLYAYDLSCAYEFCNLIDNKDESAAGFPMSHCVDMQVNKPDGLAIGVDFYVEDHGLYQCAGFRNNDEGNANGNTAACFYYEDEKTFEWVRFY